MAQNMELKMEKLKVPSILKSLKAMNMKLMSSLYPEKNTPSIPLKIMN